MSLEAGSTKNRESFIEVWRGISILIVMAFHYTDRVPYQALGSQHPAMIQFSAGKLGVYIFFVISGFLISLTLGSSRTLAEFYAKRISRLYPLFVLASLLIFAALHLFDVPRMNEGEGLRTFNTNQVGWRDLIATLLFATQLGYIWVDGVFWSILVELKFYMFIGIFAVLFGRNDVRYFSVCAILLGLIEFGVYIFVGGGEYLPANKILHGIFIAQFLPFFAVGMLMQRRMYGPIFHVCVLLCVMQSVIAVGTVPTLSLRPLLIFCFWFTLLLALDWLLLGQRFLNWIGKYSYSLYLFHQMLGLMIIKALTPRLGIDLAILIGFASVCLIAATGSWLVEWRFRRATTRLLIRLFSLIGLDRLTIGEKGPAVQPGGIVPAASLSQ